MERQFNLHEISNLTTSKLKFYKEQRGFHSVQPSSETSENLNQDDIIRLEASLTNDSFDVFDSNLLIEGKLQKKLTTEAETAWVDIVLTSDDITLELNGILRMFKEMVIYSNTDKIIERVSYPGEVSTINQFLMRDYDFTNSDGQLNLFLPDTGKGDAKNSEYIKRKNIVGSKFQLMLPLDSVFGFFTYVRIALSNLKITLELQRNFSVSRKDVIFGVKADNTEYRVFFTKIRWLIPFTKLNAATKIEYFKQFTKPINFKFLENRCNYHLVSTGENEYSFSLGNISSNVHEIIVIFKNTNKDFDQNNSTYIQKVGTEKLTGIKVTVGNINYPSKDFDFKFDVDNNEIAFPYKYYIDACNKKYGVNPILSYQDFKNLYTIFYFDLSAQDSSYINLNTPIQISIDKTNNFSPQMFVLLKLEKQIFIDFNSTGQGIKMTNLDLVNA